MNKIKIFDQNNDMDYCDVISKIKDDFFGTSDLGIKEILTVSGKASLIFIDAMIDKELVEKGILQPLAEAKEPFARDVAGLNGMLYCSSAIKATDSLDTAVQTISSGDAVMVFEGSNEYFIFAVKKYSMRSIQEPPTSTVLKGPREGFTEDLKTNMTLLRRRLRTNKLVFEQIKLGRFSETSVMIAYVKGISDEALVSKIRERLQKIDIDGILDSSYITKYLEERPYSLFKQVGNTEKPDMLAAKLLDGRIGILADGSPIALTLPFLFTEDFKDIQDDFKRPVRVSFVRILRMIAIVFAVLLPGIFVAIQEHHFQMLPSKLMITIINAEQGVPFDPIVEMMIALILFEILSEASVRMPKYVGMALSVVGALVLGDTAVKAGLLSPITVLIVALSGIGLFTIPDEVGVFSVLRAIYVLAGGLLGLFGILILTVAVGAYLTTIDVYGVPYLAPFAPMISPDIKDTAMKTALPNLKNRSLSVNTKNKRRQA